MGVVRNGNGFRWGEDGEVFEFPAGDRAAGLGAFRRAVAVGLARGGAGEMEGVERACAADLSTRVGVRKDASGDLIIAWWLPEDLAATLAVKGGEAAADLHCTLLYLGDPAAYDVELVTAVVKLFTTRWGPLDGVVTGTGTFVAAEDEDVVIALLDLPYASGLREALRDELCYNACLPPNSPVWDSGHGWLPHVTLGYFPKGAQAPVLDAALPLSLDNLTLASGPKRVSFELGCGWYDSELITDSDEGQWAPYLAARKRALALERRRITLLTANRDGGDAPAGGDLTYTVTKSRDEDRYTFGPLYAPDRLDAHEEYTDPETLQKAVWDYVRESADDGRRLNLQHDDSGDATVAEWVEVVAWPYETTVKVAVPGEAERDLTLPAGTVYMGVIWDETAWEEGVKKGKVTGLSLGGRAVRVNESDPPDEHMGDKLAARGSGDGADGLECETCGKVQDSADDLEEGVCAKCRAAMTKRTAGESERLAVLRSVAEAEERRHRAEVEVLRATADDERGLVTRLIDTVGKFAHQPQGDTHVHLPEHTVNFGSPKPKPAAD